MKIAAAQIASFKENTNANIQVHIEMIDLAAKQNVSFIVFPEMSLTGYEREKAFKLSFGVEDSRLDIFKQKAQKYQMYIVVGAPIVINQCLYIGSFVITPQGEILVYTKQYLHEGEDVYFSADNACNPIVKLNGQTISLAICADITNPMHAENAFKHAKSLYVVSFFYTPSGIMEGYQRLSDYAKKYQMNVLMANYIKDSYGLEAAGGSAFWNWKGELVSHLNHIESSLLITEI